MYTGGTMAQSQIQRTLNAAVPRIAEILSQEQFPSRHALGRRLCAEFHFVDRRGREQLAGCLKALRVLEARSEAIVLPPAQEVSVRAGPSLRSAPVAAAENVPERLAEIAGLSIEVVATRDQRKVWNTLLAQEHPHGVATFAGHQVRYLVGSRHGYLGAAGFSAAALHLAARERWVGWTDAQRRADLERVVCLSRFLIRPGVRCANLASHVLGRILRRLPGDFEARYGFQPWLVETFLEAQYDGACLKAANFVRIGETVGRGRQDRAHRRNKPVKSVFLFALCRRWRQHLGVGHVDPAPLEVLAPGEGLGADVWAANEFGGASLGDKRLTARLVKSATLLAEYPGRAIHAHPGSDNAAIDGFYRLIEHPPESDVSVKNILAPHRARTVARMRGQQTVLAIQDGSDLNFARRPHTDGLQLIGKNQTSARTLGLHLHATLAVSDCGLPLGVLRLGFDKVSKQRNTGRTTARWLDGLEDTLQATRELTRKTRVIAVCDREADVFELFDARRRAPRVELLVRARHDRCLDKKRKLFETVRSQPVAGSIEVEIEGLTERPKSSRKKARPARKKRLAHCALRFCGVELPATGTKSEPVSLSAVHIVETNPPADEKPVQWFLLTSVAVNDAKTAAEIVGYYLQRWRIEDFFRVLKSGCKTEFLLFRTADRLQRAIAINAVIAWRIMVMTLLGRQVPECEAELMFTDHELAFLSDYAAQQGLEPPENLGRSVQLVAHLGGYRGRTHDPEPGNQIMWQGYSMLTKATIGHRIGAEAGRQRGFEDGKRYMLEQVRKHVA